MTISILKRSLPWILLLAGIAVNPWTVAALLVPDGSIESAALILNIVLFQLAAVAGCLLIAFPSNLLRYLLGASISALTVVSCQNLWARVAPSQPSPAVAGGTGGPSDHQVLRNAVSLQRNQFATLALETSEVLYTLHQPTDLLQFQVPERAVLDTATGVHPGMPEVFEGKARFEIAVSRDGKTWNRKYQHTAPPADGPIRWQPVTVDLSEYAGEEVMLAFNKSYRSSKQPRKIFDIDPTDLMFWRQPRVRPFNLAQRRNVVLISLDTVRADHLHYMGYSRETSPTLDRLADEGVVFTQCISQAPWTTPSHFSILTSTYPTTHGANQPVQNKNRWWNDQTPTLAGILSGHGYTTAAFTGRGSISAEFGFYKGFDFYNESARDREGSDIEGVTRKTIDWLRDNRERTFFLFFHTYEPHEPYSDNYFMREADISGPMDERIARYDGDIRKTDRYVGQLMTTLGELDLLDSTLVVITSDHGEEFADGALRDHEPWTHGHSLYDELLRVPLIFSGLPQTAGRSIDHQVRSIDILPTILDYLGLPASEGFQGTSLKPMIAGVDEESYPALSEATTYGTARESVRANGFKYVRRLSYGRLLYEDSAGLPLTPLYELYDLSEDPGETTNVAGSRPQKLEELQEILRSLLPQPAATDDSSSGDGLLLEFQENPDLIEALESLGYL